MSTTDTHFTSNPSSTLHKYFDTGAATYEARTGGATLAIAKAILPYLEPLPHAAHIHDNASGPGITCSAILATHPSAHVTCTDNARGMISVIQTNILDHRENWANGHVDALVMDSCDLDFPPETFDASVTNFGIFMFGSPDQGAREIYRTLKPGGRAVVTSWKFVGWVPILRAVQELVMPGKKGFESALMEEWSREEVLAGCLTRGGFRAEDVEVREAETAIWGEESRLDEWMRDFAGMMGTMAGESMTEGEKGLLEGGVRALWDGRRDEFFVRGEGEGVFGVRMVALIGVARK